MLGHFSNASKRTWFRKMRWVEANRAVPHLTIGTGMEPAKRISNEPEVGEGPPSKALHAGWDDIAEYFLAIPWWSRKR